MAKGRHTDENSSYWDDFQLDLTKKEDNEEEIEDTSKTEEEQKSEEEGIDDGFTDEEAEEIDESKVKVKAEDEEEDEEEESETDADDDDNEDDSSDAGGSDDDDNADNDDSDDDSYEGLINHLVEENVLVPGEEAEYEDSEDGFKQLIEDTVEARLDALEQQRMLDRGEEAAKLIEFLDNGGSLEDFLEAEASVDFDKVDLEDVDTQKALILDNLTQIDGYSDEEASEILKEYEIAGTLDKRANTAKNRLSRAQEQQREAIVKKQTEQREKQQAETARAAQEFEEDLKGRTEIAGIPIDKKTAVALYDHITKPIDREGNSKFALNYNDTEKQLLFAYLDLQGFNMEKLLKKAESKAVVNIKKKMNNVTDKNAKRKNSGSRRETKETGISNISWDL